jgi:DNA-binding winged helix-turn-helix (wHTH) protein/TolB-like protein/Tfp pilus assembly protein PilF
METRQAGERLAFGLFELEPGTGELRKHGTLVKLQPQPFRVLVLLASHSGELVTRETIRDELWGDGTNVDFDAGLNFCIRQIRSVLVDDPVQPRYIETLAKRGYRFLAPVTRLKLPEKSPPPASPATPSPVEATPRIAEAPAPSSWARRSGWLRIGLAVPAMLLAGIGWKSLSTEPAKRILVRPFVTVGLSEEQAWLGDALAQQVSAALVGTERLQVAPWSMSLALKMQPATIREIGRRFHVDRILEGSVSLAGDRLQVSTQLVDAATEQVVWTGQYQRDAPNLAGLQDDISAALAAELKLEVAGEHVPVTRRRPQDIGTYNLYLRALYLADDLSPGPLERSIEYFHEVIRRAPDYAPAHAGLAVSQVILGMWREGAVMLADAESNARKAIEMDPGSARAHWALGHYLFQQWHWQAAEDEFRQALKLDPDLANAHQLYALYLACQGRTGQSVSEARKAVELAPTSPLFSYALAQTLFYAGRFEEAIMQGRLAVELSPRFLPPYRLLARAYTLKGMFAEAEDALRQQEQAGAGSVGSLWMANTLGRAGRREQARAAIQRWREIQKARPAPLALAVALYASGDTAGTLDAIERSVADHTMSMMWLKASPELLALHSHPRFKQALARMGLE